MIDASLAGFRPTKAVCKGPGLRFRGGHSGLISKLRSAGRVDSLELEPEFPQRAPHLHFVSLRNWEMDAIYVNAESALEPFTEWALSRTSFCCSLWHSREDVIWQGVSSISRYERAGRDHSALPKIVDDLDDLVIDIRHNPGRQTAFPGMWLQAAWRTTYAGDAFRFIPRDRLLSFPDAYSIEEHSTGAVTVQLYEDPAQCEKPVNREIQRRFREWVGMDELEAKAGDVLNSTPADPVFEWELVEGGGQRVRQWYTADGELIERSSASYGIELAAGSSLLQPTDSCDTPGH